MITKILNKSDVFALLSDSTLYHAFIFIPTNKILFNDVKENCLDEKLELFFYWTKIKIVKKNKKFFIVLKLQINDKENSRRQRL